MQEWPGAWRWQTFGLCLKVSDSVMCGQCSTAATSSSRRPPRVVAMFWLESKALASRLQLTAPVTVLSAYEVAAVVRNNPLSRVATNPSHLLVVVPLVPSGLRRLRPLLKERWAPEAVALGTRVAYLWCARGVARSPVWAAADRALDGEGTARNISTMTKLMAAVEESPSRAM